MATTTLRNGSSGSDVKKLQKALISAGYDVGSTGADGVYGKNTAAAVKAYQKANGLAVDGIAGKNTLGSLYGTGSTTNNAAKAANKNNDAKAKNIADTSDPDIVPKAALAENSDPDIAPKASTPMAPITSEGLKPFTYDDFSYSDFSYSGYEESDIVKQANALLQEHMGTKPGAYQSQWETQLNDYMNRIENREDFSYDFNNDALYQLYKDNYIQQGQMAMMDTMGQAAALTGGYGNSYAQTVGQQAYNQQLNQLNNVIPELYQQAHNQYAYEGQQMLDMYNMYLDRENQDYGRYQTDLDNWYSNLEYLTNRYDTERNYDYNRYQDAREQAYNQYTADRNLAYNEWAAGVDTDFKNYQTAIQNQQWQTEMDEDTRRYEQDRTDKLANSSSGGSGGSPSSTEPSYTKLEVGSTAYNTIVKEIDRATTLDQLKSITNTYLSMGYDPAVVNALTNSKANSLKTSQPLDTTVDDNSTDPNTIWKKTHNYGGAKGVTQKDLKA